MDAPRIFPFDYRIYDFPNGLRLVAVPTPYPEVVSLQIVVHAGSRNEVEPGHTGFAHFFEHMMFRGTPEYPPERYEAVLQAAGAASNAYTDDDRTVYHTTLTREDFDLVLSMEADRFRNLSYSTADFRTEALAVLGEYHKDSVEPMNKLLEVLRDTAFDGHTYKHTTMGFLRDIERMPEMYDYSRLFFSRCYRPEYTTIVVVGDIRPEEVRDQVERHWGAWPRGSHAVEIPPEPPPSAPRHADIPWASPTLPHFIVAQRAPAYSDETSDAAALDVISFLGFSQSSPLYERLVIEEQIADTLWAANPDHLDPYLFIALARVKESAHIGVVREAILSTLASFTDKPVPEARLESVKNHLRYRFALGLNNSESIAETLAHYLSLRRSPETIDKLYRLYARLTPEDILRAAQRYLTGTGRVTALLAHAEGGSL